MYQSVHPGLTRLRLAKNKTARLTLYSFTASFGPRTLPAQHSLGLGGLEPPTPRLSSVCSDQLSYKPLSLLLRPMHARPLKYQDDTKRDLRLIHFLLECFLLRNTR